MAELCNWKNRSRLLLFFLFFPLLAQAATLSYSVDFEGLDDSTALKTIKATAQLTALKRKPPSSINALRYRAQSDIPEIIKVLHSFGYYEATVNVRLQEEMERIRVTVHLNPGPAYKLGSFVLHLYSGTKENAITCEEVTQAKLGIRPGKRLLATDIVDAEQRLLTLLSDCGYPLAEIAERSLVADGLTKEVAVAFEVEAGPLTRFGPTQITGLESVKQDLINQALSWKQGELYNNTKVEATQKALIASGLFSSVLITHAPLPNEEGGLAITIELTESKQKSINIGVSYQTFYGPGITFGWENRNVDGLGRSLSLQGDATLRSHSGIATYYVSDFCCIHQDYIWQAQAHHEEIKAYSERSYSLTNRLERRFGKRFRLSVGAEIEKLYVTSSVDNGAFFLFALPLFLRWSTANSLLNPTEGMSVEYNAIPSVNIEKWRRNFLVQRLIYSYYYPVDEEERLVIAQKCTFGTVTSSSLGSVPLPKRFLGGSEEDLRGYHYKTVSPLAPHDKPIGGRSAIYYTFETRLRFSETLGFVPFFDFGTVWLQQIPQKQGKWFKSAGLGVRYFTFMGPFRFDVGFPLDRREGLDPVYRIIVSIGQMF